MNHNRTLTFLVFIVLGLVHPHGVVMIAQDSASPGGPDLLIRCDDVGMCHGVNAALEKIVSTGIPFSASVMFACPWYQEGVEILKRAPHVSVGIHLTLNSEWKNYRWGPVAGWGTVPSLTDSSGYFFPTRKAFFDNAPRTEEVETELRAQIDRALATGLRIDYLDYHMGAAVQTEELRGLVQRLAEEYSLGISRSMGEVDLVGFFGAPVSRKTDTLLALVDGLAPGSRRLLVVHIGLETAEMSALIDLNQGGLTEIGRHRNAELNAIMSPRFLAALKREGIRLLTYRQLMEETAPGAMERPGTGGYR